MEYNEENNDNKALSKKQLGTVLIAAGLIFSFPVLLDVLSQFQAGVDSEAVRESISKTDISLVTAAIISKTSGVLLINHKK